MLTREELRLFLQDKKNDPNFFIYNFAEECGISKRNFVRIMSGEGDFYKHYKQILDTANKHGYKKYKALNMKRISVFRDGGTAIYSYKGKDYYLDNRIRSTTIGQWYSQYPLRDNSNIITDKELVKELNKELNKLNQYGK